MSIEAPTGVSFVDPDEPAKPTLHVAVADTIGGIIDAIVASDRMLATVSSWRARLIDDARQWSELNNRATATSRSGGWNAETIARRELVTELACALRIPERAADKLVTTSETLVQKLPGTFEALRDGDVSYRHAEALVDHAKSLPDEAVPAFEGAILPDAKTLTVAKLDRKALRVREHMHPDSIVERHETAVEDRSVSIEPTRDGMAWLNAYLPAEQAIGIDDRLTQIADALKTDAEDRTLSQLRADIFIDLLADGEINASGESLGRGLRPRVLVTVPVMTILGHDDEPAKLEGYGPIDPATAKKLTAKAPSFTRLLTHPETGAVLSVGQDRYAVPKDLRTWLRVRDETCRFPGCSRRAGNCEVDHTVDWQYEGETRHDNLAHLCPSHHHVKHQTRWTVANSPNGVLTWTSPTGRSYTTHPAVRVRAPG